LLTVRSRLVPSGSLTRVQLRLEVVSVGIPVSWLFCRPVVGSIMQGRTGICIGT
jgi:hypothetical protein